MRLKLIAIQRNGWRHYSKTAHQDVMLDLFPYHPTYMPQDTPDVVYQNAAYEYEIGDLASAVDVRSVDVFINGKRISSDFEINSAVGDAISIYPQEGEMRAFQQLYGLTYIAVRLLYEDGREEYLFSDWLAVAVPLERQELMDSVKDMLNDIYGKNHAMLYQNSFGVPLHVNGKQLEKHESLDSELTLLARILHVFREEAPYFMEGAFQRTVSQYRLDRVEKLTSFTNRNLRFISTHPEELEHSPSNTGIYLNNQYFVPKRTLIQTQSFSCDTPENRTVLAFISLLIEHLTARERELRNSMDGAALFAKEDRGQLEKGYVLSTAIINQYVTFSLREYLQKISNLRHEFAGVLAQYRQMLPCHYQPLKGVPRPSPVFLEIHHYHSIYEMINLWFSGSDFRLPGKERVLRFTSADTIYEYYCLLTLYDIITGFGFKEKSGGSGKNRSHLHYSYLLSNPFYEESEGDNTFYFTNGHTNVTLYYEPVIYSGKVSTTNGITLFRTTGRSNPEHMNFYLPDFLLKKESVNGVSYGIIDAKWRPREILLSDKSGGLKDLCFKYLYSIADSRTMKNVDFLWLLQGKDDDSAPMYIHHNNGMSRSFGDKFRYATGIVTLTPRSGSRNLAKVIGTFLR